MEVSDRDISDTEIGETIIRGTVIGNATIGDDPITDLAFRNASEAVAVAEYRDAICFRADFAATGAPESLTYFGGRPCLPPQIAWPEVRRRGNSHALTFLGQVDLADVAATGSATPLPSAGVLYFFLDTNIINLAGLIDASLDGSDVPAPVMAATVK